MNILKYMTSFFSPVRVEERRSAVSGKIEVLFSGGKYVLDSAHVNYSFGGLHRVFQRAFAQAGIKDRKITSALILGFGSGSVASILREEYRMQAAITGVEKDPEVIALAQKYFAVNKYKNLDLICADAHEFVFRCNKKFELVVMDVFVDRNVPDIFFDEKFLSRLEKILSEKGILFFNLVVHNEKVREKGAKLFRDLNLLVGKTEWCRIHSHRTENWVFAAGK